MPRFSFALDRTLIVLVATGVLATVVSLPILRFPQLDADDYRYLHLVAELRAGRIGLLPASIIENRWDHLWWIDCQEVVRFFRPTLMLSYLLDHLVHGGSALGLLLTNAALYVATCLLGAFLFVRLLPGTLAPLVAGLAFAGCASHAETIWYVAGRNETLAALGLLGALACHTASGRLRLAALPCYLFALASKELTLPLPLLGLALDRMVLRRAPTLAGCVRRDLALYAGYALLAVVYLLGRHAVLAAAGGSDLVFPYFVAPSRPDFATHVWHQVRVYGENLLLAGITPPFLRPDQVPERASVVGTVLTLLVPALLLAWLRKDPRTWFFALLAAATWLPTTVVYVSERYLFLPSFAFAGVLGLAVRSAAAHVRMVPAAPFVVRLWRLGLGVAALGLALAWLGQQAFWLYLKNRLIIERTQDSIALEEKFAALRPSLPPGAPIYLLNFPSNTFSAQFVEDMVRVVLGDPARRCRVLTVLPEDEALSGQTSTEVRRLDDHEIEVIGRPALMTHAGMLFPWTSLGSGTRVERERMGFAVQVVDGTEDRCRTVRIRLPHALEDGVFLRFSLPGVAGAARGDLIRHGALDRLRP